ncbi:hypothetical protein LTR37_009905 [Vermiconidia calcicola]|uniref:Uncharacterized protein n=1 Tax=Vermiconidia calcicola TaxID=1690605 RepID=A0ACC3N6L8_9PEZI|nr:hypothetical protein LTR37_009905 [Vermiconidia calcicola]
MIVLPLRWYKRLDDSTTVLGRMAESKRAPPSHLTEQFREGMANIGDRHVDFILKCGDREFKVHRIVIDCQSSLLSTLSDRDAREMTLEQDEPEVLQALIDFFYKDTYEVPASPNNLSFHVRVAAMAVKYESGPLQCRALERIWEDRWDEHELVNMIRELEKHLDLRQLDLLRFRAISEARESLDRLVRTTVFQDMVRDLPDWTLRLLKAIAMEGAPGCQWLVKSALASRVVEERRLYAG